MKIYERYLKAIEQSNPLPLFAFKDWCTKQLEISEELFSRIFSVTASNTPKYYLIAIKEQQLFSQYFSRFNYTSSDNKVEAALHGNSKKGKINGGILNFKHHFFDKHGTTVCFQNGNCDFKPTSDNLLLIENLNNFLNPNDVCVGVDENNLESNVIWSKGNEITSRQYTEFLNSYTNIICFFDFDIGGFEAFYKLKQSLKSDIHIIFYHPKNLTQYLTLFGKIVTDKQLLALRKYRSVIELNQIINEILSLKVNGQRTIRFLEQEALQISLENENNE